MKKATKKAVAKPAAKKAAKKAAVKVVAEKTVGSLATKTAIKKAIAGKVAKTRPVAIKAISSNASKTAVVANIDVGFGNKLYLRGDAPGLSWKKGVPMDCTSAGSWSITMSGVKEIFEFKVLINDIHWAIGGNNIAKPNATNSSDPTF